MTHEEQRRYLIRELLAEDAQYQSIVIPEDAQGQRDLFRALMNVRPPMPVVEKFLTVQDEYLSAERDMGEWSRSVRFRPSAPTGGWSYGRGILPP